MRGFSDRFKAKAVKSMRSDPADGAGNPNPFRTRSGKCVTAYDFQPRRKGNALKIHAVAKSAETDFLNAVRRPNVFKVAVITEWI